MPRSPKSRIAAAIVGLEKRAIAAVLLGATGLGVLTGAAPAHGAPLPEAQAPVEESARTEREPEPPKVEILSPRVPRLVPLADPSTDTSTHAADYAIAPVAAGFALDAMAARYPEINEHFAARALEWSMVAGAEVPWMVLSHEGGHYRVGKAFGWNPEIEMTGWASGLTRYEIPSSDLKDTRKRAIAAAGGVNQQELNAVYMYRDWARNRGARYPEAMAYLLAQTNEGLYAANSARKGDGSPPSDDIAAYVRLMNERGHRLTRTQLALMALAADAASAPVWSSLIGQGRFLAKGDRVVEIPELQIGPVTATFPSFHTLLGSDGPIVGGRAFIQPNGRVPVEVELDVQLDGKALAAGTKLYDVPIAEGVALNPFLRLSTGPDGPGARIGTDVRFDLTPRLSVVGTAEYSHADLLSEVEGRRDGFAARIHLGFVF